MRAILASLGTMGDFQPFLALALELRRQGHHPVLANSPDFSTRAEQFGIEFYPLGPPMQEMNMHSMISSSLNMSSPIEQARHSTNAVIPFVPQMFRELCDLCRDADALICFPYQLAGRMVHEKLGIPYVSIHFSPFGAFGTKQFKDATATMINDCRQQEGLPPLDDPLGMGAISDQLALYTVSQHIFRRPTRWPAHHHVTGYFFLDEQWCPNPELAEFINSPEPLVVITFGSLVHSDPLAITNILVDAVQQVGCRAIIQQGWSGLGREQLPTNLRIVDFVPHSYLFSKAACIVHHGAAGTTAAALRAGVPSVIVPHWLDQPIWAELVRGMRGAEAVIPFQKLTAKDLAEAIDKTLKSDKCVRAAAALGEKIRAENGTQTACQLIQQLLG